MLCTEVMANCSDNYTKHISRLYTVCKKKNFLFITVAVCVCVSLEFQELIISFMIFFFVSFFPDYFKSRRSNDATTIKKTSAAVPIL